MANLGHQLAEEGYTVIRFDCVGAGEDSEGDWSDMTISGEIQDLAGAALDPPGAVPEKLMVIGYSMGGLRPRCAAGRCRWTASCSGAR